MKRGHWLVNGWASTKEISCWNAHADNEWHRERLWCVIYHKNKKCLQRFSNALEFHWIPWLVQESLAGKIFHAQEPSRVDMTTTYIFGESNQVSWEVNNFIATVHKAGSSIPFKEYILCHTLCFALWNDLGFKGVTFSTGRSRSPSWARILLQTRNYQLYQHTIQVLIIQHYKL